MRPNGNILIIGGYGKVGRSIAERLAPLFPGRVIVAGRSLDKAKAAAAGIGHGAEGRAVDILTEDAGGVLDGVTLALACLSQTDTRFVEQCLSRGVHYVDISADYDFLLRVEKLDGLAKRHGATAILSVGVAPGLTNMLAARARQRMERVERIDILLELGLGDHHGQAAVEWIFDNLDAEYDVKDHGRAKSVRSFGESLNLRLPGQRAGRPAYRFNFSDQHVIARTLGVPTVSTWLRLEDRVSTWMLAKSSRAGIGRLLRRPWWRKVAVWLFMNVHMGSAICGVAVRATGRTENGEDTLTLGLIGRKEALMTAIIAAETVRQLLSGNPIPGILHSEQAVKLDPVVSALRRDLPDLVVAL
ncbi:MAG TPA: saccharopine dehydrogenase NADP-binding domain-containing protein [Alphaproteobacteria bacterium]|nr:saccharopine dehydrogenase NADP-binding domain-containing protein [Alphaproteobacteria bacterium]